MSTINFPLSLKAICTMFFFVLGTAFFSVEALAQSENDFEKRMNEINLQVYKAVFEKPGLSDEQKTSRWNQAIELRKKHAPHFPSSEVSKSYALQAEEFLTQYAKEADAYLNALKTELK